MRTIIHLSDLHFGRVDREVADALAATVASIAPQVVVVSGDFTQRARAEQFRDARAFLDSLGAPAVVVPGNHDIPLHNVFARFLTPLAGYRRYITTDLTPSYADPAANPELVIVGTDTTRSFTVGGGGIRRREVRRIRDILSALDESVVKVVVAHHPFDTPYAAATLRGSHRGAEAVELLTRAGVDLFLTGHLHVSYAGPTATRYKVAGRSAIVVEAGTATSTRVRGESNAFNVVRIDASAMVVEHLEWQPGARAFAPGTVQRFARTADGWRSG
jgi:3',5'-cyclic AMP phosphodiesterase CpdA